MIKVINLSGGDIPSGFELEPGVTSALTEVTELWRQGKIKLKPSDKSFNPANVDYLLSDVELRRIKATHGDMPISAASRLSVLEIPESARFGIFSGLKQHFPDLISNLSGSFWYKPGGFMSWHTNSNDAGLRLYMSYADETGKSFFRYQDPGTGKIETSDDVAGWQFRVFSVGPGSKFWHCVKSGTNRLSLGLRLNQVTP